MLRHKLSVRLVNSKMAEIHGFFNDRYKIKIYTDWANHYLEKNRSKRSITDLQQDVSDGVLLADVIEAVTNEKVRDIKTKPRSQAHMVENINACLSYLASLGINTEGISAKDIREGNLKAILGLFFSLSRYKQQQKHAAASSSNAKNGNNNTTTTESKLPLLNKSRCPTVTNPSSKDSSPVSQERANLNKKPHSFNSPDRSKQNLNQQNNNTLSPTGTAPGRNSNSTSPTSSSRSSSIPTPRAGTRSRSPAPRRSHSLSDKSTRLVNSPSYSSTSSATSATSKTTSNSAASRTNSIASGYTSSASATSTISNRSYNKNSMLDRFKFFGSNKDKVSKAKSDTSATSSEAVSPKTKSRKLLGSRSPSKRDSAGSADGRLRTVSPPANVGPVVQQQRPLTPPANYGRTIQRSVTPPANYGRMVNQKMDARGREVKQPKIPQVPQNTPASTPGSHGPPLPQKITASTGLNSPNTSISLPNNTGIPKPGSKPANKAALHSSRMKDSRLQNRAPNRQNGNYDPTYDQVYQSREQTEQSRDQTDQSDGIYQARDSQAPPRDQRRNPPKSLDKNANMATPTKSSLKVSPSSEHKRTKSVGTSDSSTGLSQRKLPSLPDKNSPTEFSSASNSQSNSQSNSASQSSSSNSENTAKKVDSTTNTGNKYVKLQPRKPDEIRTISKGTGDDSPIDVKPMTPMAPLQPRNSPYAYLRSVQNNPGGNPQNRSRIQKSSLMAQYGSSSRLRVGDQRYMAQRKQSDGDYASECDLDLATGYMSDGDVLRQKPADDLSGYISEGGASVYARRMQQRFREGMMQAVSECMSKSSNVIDDDSFDDSSSISSGDISDTIGDISTDENLGGQQYSHSAYSSPRRDAGQQQIATGRSYQGYDYTAWRRSGTQQVPSMREDGNYTDLDYSSEPETTWRKRQPPHPGDFKPGYYATSSLRRNSDYTQLSTENLMPQKQQRCPPPGDAESMIIMRKQQQQQQQAGMPMSTFGYRRTSTGGEPPLPPTRTVSGKPPAVRRNARGDYENIYTNPDGSPRRSYAPSEEQPRRTSLVASKTQTFTSPQQKEEPDGYKSNTLGRRRASAAPAPSTHGSHSTHSTSGGNLTRTLSNEKLLSLLNEAKSRYAHAQTGDRGRSMSVSIPNPTNPQTWLGKHSGSTEVLNVEEKIQQARNIARNSVGDKQLGSSHRRSLSQSLERGEHKLEVHLSSAPVSPTPSTGSQNASRFTYPMADPGHLIKSLSNQNLVRSGSQQLYHSLLPKSDSRDDNFRGSSLSLSSSCSQYSTLNEEKQAGEIKKLRRELEHAQEKVATLTSQLSTNAHVVSAFEQSLSNMTHRLHSLSNTSDQKNQGDPTNQDTIEDSELNDLRQTIESIRKQSGGIRIAETPNNRRVSAPAQPAQFSVYSSPEHSVSHVPEHMIDHQLLQRHLSSESMNSMSSANSGNSQQNSAAEQDRKNMKDKQKKDKGGWLRASFGKAFNKKKLRKTSSSEADDGTVPASDVSVSVPNSPLLMTSHSQQQVTPVGGFSQTAPSTPMNMIKHSSSHPRVVDENDRVTNLQKKLQEKDMKLTDVQLEALSSAHQLEQLRETMSKMKNEMSTLKADNERLQKMVVKSPNSSSPTSPEPTLRNKRNKSTENLDSPVHDHQPGNMDVMLNEGGPDARRVLVSVYTGSGTDVSTLLKNLAPEVLIGCICITGKISWDMLDTIVRRYFKDYCIKVDPACHLGLNTESVYSYHIGDVVRSKDSPNTPDLLPCGYLDRQDTRLKIVLKSTEQQALDSLSFETLIPKSIIQRYISLLVEHRRIILCGPSGTGKTYLAQKLAEFLVKRSGRVLDASAISTFSVEHKSSKELRQYLGNIADQCQDKQPNGSPTDLPCVVILDNLHHVGSLSEVFDGFLSCKYQKSPYIIGTMNQATCSTTNLQLHHNFRWVLCANHMEPVKGFLARFLKRKLIESELKTGKRNPDLAKMVEWVPQVWQKLNKFLETHSSSDVTIGPRLFLSCPMDVSGSQVWFTDLYNYSLVPYLMDATREGLQLYGRRAIWEDPADWVVETYPWPKHNNDVPNLHRLRPEDVGYDNQAQAPGTPSKQQHSGSQQTEQDQDPLLNMLMRLQEAASYSNPQSADSDSQHESLESSKESTI